MGAWPAIGDAVLVQVALGLCYAVVPALALRLRRTTSPEQWLTVITGALCLQSMLGWCWNHLRPAGPHVELALYAAVWVGIGLLVRARRLAPRPTGVTMEVALLAVCAAGFVLRLIHPVLTPALGQSDAYSHLQFIGDILERGHIRNPAYPAGYHWVMMVPAALGLEPYMVARFGGAWMGALMPLAFYVLLRDRAGRMPALLAAWAVALCPALFLLIKTGIGVYPNQFGLLLLPCIGHAYLRWVEAPRPARGLAALVLVGGLVSACPMMLTDLAIVVAAERVWSLVRAPRRSSPWWWVLVAFAALAASVVIWQVSRTGYDRLASTVTSLTGRPLGENAGARPAVAVMTALVRDYFAIKRPGLGSPIADVAAAVLLCAFLWVLMSGWRARRTDWVFLGAWGLMATLQTATGLLQFSRYQRAGWQLLEAAVWAGGVAVGWWIVRPLCRWAWLRGCTVAGLLVVSIFAFAHFPRHRVFQSAAEDDLVKLFRSIERHYARAQGQAAPWGFTTARLSDKLPINPRNALTVLIRPFTGFTRGHGDLTHALLRRRPGIAIEGIGIPRPPVQLVWPRQYLILLEDPSVRSAADLGVSARLNGDLAGEFLDVQQRAQQARAQAAEILAGFDRTRWRVDQIALSPDLEAWFIRASHEP